MIGGNIYLTIKSLDNTSKTYDTYGKRNIEYKEIKKLWGWLDLANEDSRYTYKAKIEDSTHVFVCDYEDLSDVDIENSKAFVNGQEYDIKYIDNPMLMNKQIEIYLEKVGGQ